MRKLLERLRGSLTEFVDQRDDVLLLVDCGDNDAALVTAAVGDVDLADGADVFLTFVDAFVQPAAYVSVVVERLREQRQMACDLLAAEGREPLPELPARLSDLALDPGVRLAEAIAYARGLLPAEPGHRLVWTMLPPQIADARQYAELLARVAPWSRSGPSYSGVRLIARRPPNVDSVALASGREVVIDDTPRTRVLPVSLGPEALEEGLKEEVADEQAPADERMSAYLSLALLDVAHFRVEPAQAKLNHLLGYYQQTDQPLRQGIVLNALGDLQVRQGDAAGALAAYECAAAQAMRGEAHPLLQATMMSLGRTSMELGRLEDAERYFAQSDALAGHLIDAQGKADALVCRGIALERQQQFAPAIENWQQARLLSRSTGMADKLRISLQHLQQALSEHGPAEALDDVRRELATLSREEIHS